MDEMPGGFLIYYAERGEEIIYANRSLLRIFGCETMEEFRAHTGNSFRGIVHPDELEAVEKSIWAQIASSQYDLDYVEYRICCRDGSTRWIEDYGHYVDIKGVGGIFYVFLGDATGKRARMLEGKNRLISERLEAEQKFQTLLSEALAKANLAVSSKNAFLSNISHDMRTPLHAIFGFTSLAKMNLDNPEEARNYLSRVETSSQQLLDMINKVLEISAMTDSEGMEETRCSLREIADEVYEFLRPQAREKNLVFRLDCGSLTHNAVFADRDKLRQLILYLSNNAVTYTNPGGQVTVSITEGENLPNDHAVYRFVIQDTGIGISPEFLDQIFEPFSREKNSTLSGIHGIGLGLTVAKNIADLMGGHIDVKSIVGEGSTFTVTLTLRYHMSGNPTGLPVGEVSSPRPPHKKPLPPGTPPSGFCWRRTTNSTGRLRQSYWNAWALPLTRWKMESWLWTRFSSLRLELMTWC